MAQSKPRDIWQYGDFQTPLTLAAEVCATLVRRGVKAPAILEPTCGRGAFLGAAASTFAQIRTLLGVDINAEYVAEAKGALPADGIAQIEVGDFFVVDWDQILTRDAGPWLILGNPPWVTNADLGSLNSGNLPTKSNFQGHQGLDAITGKANFDISEWMLLEQLSWLKQRSGWIAMLVKTSVARKILRQAWKRSDPVGRAAIYKVDAMRHFGAAVDACLFVLPVNIGETAYDCDVFSDIDSDKPTTTIGFHDNILVWDVESYGRRRHLIAPNADYIWRSGVKHDCAKVMELSMLPDRSLVNGHQERVAIEQTYLFPMLKSSDVAKGHDKSHRLMIVTQQCIGGNTSEIKSIAPDTWRYLNDHAGPLDARASVIYKKKPRFSVFGVGDYTFAPWKIAVSGFYKNIRFVKIGPVNGRPTIFDDTIYFLPCASEEEANFILSLVQSAAYQELMKAMVFEDEKRPITADLLKRISLERVAKDLDMTDTYQHFTQGKSADQLSFALAG